MPSSELGGSSPEGAPTFPEREPASEKKAEEISNAVEQEDRGVEEKTQEKLGRFERVRTYLNKHPRLKGMLVNVGIGAVVAGAKVGIRSAFQAAGMVHPLLGVGVSAGVGGIYGGVIGYRKEAEKQYSFETIDKEIQETIKPKEDEVLSDPEVLERYSLALEKISGYLKYKRLDSDTREKLIDRYNDMQGKVLKDQIEQASLEETEDEQEKIDQYLRIFEELEQSQEAIQSEKKEHFSKLWKERMKSALWRGAKGAAYSAIAYVAFDSIIGHFRGETAISAEPTPAGASVVEHAEIPQAPEVANFSGGELDPAAALEKAMEKPDLDKLLETLKSQQDSVGLEGVDLDEVALGQVDETGQTIAQKITEKNSLPMDEYLYAHGIDASHEIDGQTLSEHLKSLFVEGGTLESASLEVQEKIIYEIMSYPELLNNANQATLNQLIDQASQLNSADFAESVHAHNFVQEHYVGHLGRAIDNNMVENSNVVIKELSKYIEAHNPDLIDRLSEGAQGQIAALSKVETAPATFVQKNEWNKILSNTKIPISIIGFAASFGAVWAAIHYREKQRLAKKKEAETAEEIPIIFYGEEHEDQVKAFEKNLVEDSDLELNLVVGEDMTRYIEESQCARINVDYNKKLKPGNYKISGLSIKYIRLPSEDVRRPVIFFKKCEETDKDKSKPSVWRKLLGFK